jgi:nicotinamide-nucleotide amidase
MATQLAAAVQAVANTLLRRQWMLATAESCTGGMVAAACTDLAGSSAWLERGFVTYSNAAKTQMLGVDAQLIASHGAVSEPVARAMAQGALQHSAAQVALAITGVAGPGGGSEVVGLARFLVDPGLGARGLRRAGTWGPLSRFRHD